MVMVYFVILALMRTVGLVLRMLGMELTHGDLVSIVMERSVLLRATTIVLGVILFVARRNNKTFSTILCEELLSS